MAAGRNALTGGFDVRANPRVILHARLALEARARIDCPRMDGVDRCADVLGAEASGEHDPSVHRSGALEMVGILRLPGKIEHARHLLPIAQESTVASSHLPFLVRVELDEIRSVSSGLADVDGYREHRLGHWQYLRRPARALVANLPRSIAERELAVVKKKLVWESSSLIAESVSSHGPGNIVLLEVGRH